MKNRFRNISDRQLIGLFLLLRALTEGKKSVCLSNKCLCSILKVRAIHDKRIRELASSFGPFLGEYKIQSYLGCSKAATFFLPGTTEETDSFALSTLPTSEEMEKFLRLTVREIETERQDVTLVNKANFST